MRWRCSLTSTAAVNLPPPALTGRDQIHDPLPHASASVRGLDCPGRDLSSPFGLVCLYICLFLWSHLLMAPSRRSELHGGPRTIAVASLQQAEQTGRRAGAACLACLSWAMLASGWTGNAKTGAHTNTNQHVHISPLDFET